MPSRKFTLNISDRARKDFKKIARDTKREWGKEQAVIYNAMLRDKFSLIKDNPGIGHQRDDVPEGLLCAVARSHLIFYRIRENEIYISCILHNKMDFARHLPIVEQ